MKFFLRNRRPYYCIIGTSLLVYLQVLSFDFIYLDDNILILDNFKILNDLSNIGMFFIKGPFGLPNIPDTYYRPILNISLMLDSQLGGITPIFYHFTNIALHTGSAILFYVLGQRLGYKKSWTLFFSLIFATHPVLSQTVAWVPARNDSLMTVFILSSLILFFKFLKTNNSNYLIPHAILFLLGLFTKESAVGLIILASLLSISKPKRILQALPWWGGAITIWWILRDIALKDGHGLSEYPITDTLIQNFFPVNLDFLGKIFYPFDLRVIANADTLNIWPGIVALFLLATGLYWAKKFSIKMVIWGALFFGGFLFPSIAFSNYLILDNRIYLPMLGVLIILLEIFNNKDFNKTCFHIGVPILIILAVTSAFYVRNFRERLAFWEQAVIDAPTLALAHGSLGNMYLLDGNLEKAEEEYNKCLKLNPREKKITNNLGLIYKKRKQFDIATQLFQQEMIVNPKYDAPHFNLANVFYETGNFQKAVEHWEITLEKNPNYIDAYKNLRGYYYQIKDMEKVEYYTNEIRKRGGE